MSLAERTTTNLRLIESMRKARREHPRVSVNSVTVDHLVDALEAAENAIKAQSTLIANLQDGMGWVSGTNSNIYDEVRRDILCRLAQLAPHLSIEDRLDIAGYAAREVKDDVDRKPRELRFETNDLPDATDIDGDVIPGLLSCRWCSHQRALHKQIAGCIAEGCGCGAGPKLFERESRSVSDD